MVTLLVLGRSVVFGHALDSEQQAWPYHLRSALETELKTEVRLELRRLTPDGRDPASYLQRIFDETHPDVVTIVPSPYDFAIARVENRINEIFGVRAGRAARWVEKRTTKPSAAGKQGRVNRWARRISARFIGAAPELTHEQVERTFEGVYRFLAQRESLAVVVRESPRPSPWCASETPVTPAYSTTSTRNGSARRLNGTSIGARQRNSLTPTTCAMACTPPQTASVTAR